MTAGSDPPEISYSKLTSEFCDFFGGHSPKAVGSSNHVRVCGPSALAPSTTPPHPTTAVGHVISSACGVQLPFLSPGSAKPTSATFLQLLLLRNTQTRGRTRPDAHAWVRNLRDSKRKGHFSKGPAQFLKTTHPQSENVEGFSAS